MDLLATLIGLNKLKEDALNQVNKEIQRTTRYRSRDFRSGKKGELIDKETVQESVNDVTKVSSGPSLGIVKQNLIIDNLPSDFIVHVQKN